jgi:hypothetical protein
MPPAGSTGETVAVFRLSSNTLPSPPAVTVGTKSDVLSPGYSQPAAKADETNTTSKKKGFLMPVSFHSLLSSCP